jgi:hypothetical protein
LSSHSSEDGKVLTLIKISEILSHWSSLTPRDTLPEAITLGIVRDPRAEIGRALASCLALLTFESVTLSTLPMTNCPSYSTETSTLTLVESP